MASANSAQSPAGSAKTPIFPLSEVKAGMRAIGKTVFQGTKVEEFNVEILGVLDNAGPRQSIILARLSGGPIDKTGVMQGMSGSPVYIDGQLLGAVALAFPFSKEPIAGIRPIEEMLKNQPAERAAARPSAEANPLAYGMQLPARASYAAGAERMAEISTPLRLSGFTPSTLDMFGAQLRAAGLEPMQGGAAGGGNNSNEPAHQAGASLQRANRIEPGSMISVQLLTGDLSASADGTVTLIDGDRVYAFGHKFMGQGETALPMARAEVVALLASLNSSFKITSSLDWIGAISSDRSTAISGRLGEHAPMIPVKVLVRGANREWYYRFEMARDRVLTPLLTQIAVYSIIEATERVNGPQTIQASGTITLDGAPKVRIENLWSPEAGASQVAASAIAAQASAIVGSGFKTLTMRSIDLDLTITSDRREMRLDSVWTSRREVHPGDSFEIFARFLGESGVEVERSVNYAVPLGAPAGTLNVTVADATSANILEYRQFLSVPPRDAVQLVEFLNGLRSNRKAWVRLWRATPSWTAQGETLPAPPASMMLLLGRSSLPQTMGAKVSELEMSGGDYSFTGSKTVQVEIKD